MENIEIVRYDDTTGIRIKGKVCLKRSPIHTILCVDTSGSMDMNNKLENVKKSLQIFTKCLANGDAVSIITFDTLSRIILKNVIVSDDTRIIIEDALRLICSGGTTNMSAGLLNCFQCIETNSTRKQGILLLTDGHANQGESSTNKIIDFVSLVLHKQAEISLTTIAYGLDHNAELLKGLATIGLGSYNLVENLEDVATVFGSILGSMLSIVCQNIIIKFKGVYTLLTNQNIFTDRDNLEICVGDLHAEEAIVIVMKGAGSFEYKISYNDIENGFIEKIIAEKVVLDLPDWVTLKIWQQRVSALIGQKSHEGFLDKIDAEIVSLQECHLCDHAIIKRLIQELVNVKRMFNEMTPENATVSMIQRSCVLGLGRGISSPSQGQPYDNDPLVSQNDVMREMSGVVRSLSIQPSNPANPSNLSKPPTLN